MKHKTIIISGYEVNLITSLGEGTYGSVYLVNINGEQQAIKIITNGASEGIKSLKELDIMSRLSHPNLVSAKGITVIVDDVTTVGILMPLATTDLSKILQSDSFTLQQRLKLLVDITTGLKYLYGQNYLHLDLKPMNILIFYDQNGEMITKITDFGLSQIMGANKTKYYPAALLTVTHRPPEIFSQNWMYTEASDIWSLGIIFLQVLSWGKRIYTSFQDSEVIITNYNLFAPKNINKTLESYLSNLPISIKNYSMDLIGAMLSWDYRSRPKYDQILSHELFSNMVPNLHLGLSKYYLPLKPVSYSAQYYQGFDQMIRLFLQLPTSVETFYLASDIYQRSLAYIKPNDLDDKIWVETLIITSTYMSIKILEPFKITVEKLIKLSHSSVSEDKIYLTEAFLVQSFGGKIYQKNLFTEAITLDRLLQGFEYLRNCFLYHKIDLIAWRGEIKQDNNDVLYMTFNDFLAMTTYYRKYMSVLPPENYLPILYNMDYKMAN
jgi:serine/threonine protein kinase